MSIVTVVPPMEIVLPEKKVAAYCRVSTHDPEQLASLAAQERYYEDLIRANTYWAFVGIYSDIGTGTQVKRRRRFMQWFPLADGVKLT